VSYHSAVVDHIWDDSRGNRDWKTVYDLVTDGIRSGIVRPLETRVFTGSDVTRAFQCVADGENVRKVLVEVHKEVGVEPLSLSAIRRTVFDPRRCYVLVGGLGGLGLELTQWMIERGARHVMLVSKRGVRTGYQDRCIRHWRRAGVQVLVSTRNVANVTDGLNQARAILSEASSMVGVDGIGGVFNLAAELHDSFVGNLTMDLWNRTTSPKVNGTLISTWQLVNCVVQRSNGS
jgi:fatty acid synthase